jgi:hypothetical protein
MVSASYKPSLKATVETCAGVATIRCTAAALKAAEITAPDDQAFIERSLLSESICSCIYWFADSERARQLLKIDDLKEK